MAGSILWEHQDRGTELWRPYGPILTAELEQVHSSRTHGVKSVVKYSCLGETKEVHLDSMTERNVGARNGPASPNVRRVVCEGPEWFWDDGQTWVRYGREQSEVLESQCSSGASSASLSIGNWWYEVSFDEGMFSQRNTYSGTIRPVIRVDFSFLFGTSTFEVGVWENVLEVRQEEDASVMKLARISISDDEDQLLVDANEATENDTCVLCLDEFDADRPAMRLYECHGHYFHRSCDVTTSISHVVKLLRQCPVCAKPYGTKIDEADQDTLLSPISPSSSLNY